MRRAACAPAPYEHRHDAALVRRLPGRATTRTSPRRRRRAAPTSRATRRWLAARPGTAAVPLHRHTVRGRLCNLARRSSPGSTNGARRRPSQRRRSSRSDLPIKDEPLPRFLDDAAATKLLAAARADPDPFTRLAVELLARTGLRKGELLGLTVDAVVQIGSAYWLRIPVGKLHNDRYVPLHPQLKDTARRLARPTRPTDLRSNLMFIERGRPITASRVDAALAKLAADGRDRARHAPPAPPHPGHPGDQPRHVASKRSPRCSATSSLHMTLVYARIADRTVADEYFAVTEKVEALYDQPTPTARRRRRHRDGASSAARCTAACSATATAPAPSRLDCHFESICESCTFFVTTIEFRPTLQRQRDDAAAKGQARPPEDLRRAPGPARPVGLLTITRITMDSSADFTVVPPGGSSRRVSTAKRNPGGTPTAGRGQGREGVSGSATRDRVGSFVATSGQKPWPSAGSFVAAYGQFFMAADTRWWP